jgi:hypothetical protein
MRKANNKLQLDVSMTTMMKIGFSLVLLKVMFLAVDIAVELGAVAFVRYLMELSY